MMSKMKNVIKLTAENLSKLIPILLVLLAIILVVFLVFDIDENKKERVSGIEGNIKVTVPEYYNEPVVVQKGSDILSIVPLSGNSVPAERQGNQFIYRGAYPNTDVFQTEFDYKIKDEMVFNSPGHPLEFYYSLGNIDNFYIEKDERGNLVFYNKEIRNRGENVILSRVFTLYAPFVEDSQGNKSYQAVSAEIENSLLKIVLDEEWMGEAHYPVILDPTVEINILNLYSHPQQGENWEVFFTTVGKKDLFIIPNDEATINDDEFLSLQCGDEFIEPQILPGDILKVNDWQCNDIAKVAHYTLRAGKHTLRFEFGNEVAYAYNDVVFQRAASNTGTSLSIDVGQPGNDRLVIVVLGDEHVGNDTFEGTVSVNGINFTQAAVASNPDGAGNHLEIHTIDEASLGSTSGVQTISYSGGDSGWAIRAAVYYGVKDDTLIDSEKEDVVVGSTVSVENVTSNDNSLVFFAAGNGSSGGTSNWTSPLIERIDGATNPPSSAVLGIADGIETTGQTNKTYSVTAGSSLRSTGIVLVFDMAVSNTAAYNDIVFQRAASNTGTSLSIDVGQPGNDRLVVVVLGDEHVGNDTFEGTVSINGINFTQAAVASNPDGAGNHLEVHTIDEVSLGSTSGVQTISYSGGDSGWAIRAAVYYGVKDDTLIDSEKEDVVVGSTVSVENVTSNDNSLVFFAAGNGSSGGTSNWTSPLIERIDGATNPPSSAVLGIADGIETTGQTNKTYTVTAGGSLRSTGIVLVFDMAVSNTAPSIISVTESEDPIAANKDLYWNVDWNDADAGEMIKVFVCKTNSITTSTPACTDGAWAASPVFTNRDPEGLAHYTTTVSDIGTQNYYVFVCDDSGDSDIACSNSTAGTFTVEERSPSAPTDLLVENMPNPVNVSTSTPRFSAVFNDPNLNDIANKYCIQVNTASNFSGTDMWVSDGNNCNTGISMVDCSQGDRCQDFYYNGTALSLNNTVYYWRIWYWDDSGSKSATSTTANFTMANGSADVPRGVRLKGGQMKGGLRLK